MARSGKLDSRFERNEVPDRKPGALGRVGRLVGGLIAIIGMVGGTGLIMLGIIAQFDTESAIHPYFRPQALYSSFDNRPVELSDASNQYAATSLRNKLDGCTIRSVHGGPTEQLVKDTSFTERSVFRFEAGPGTYEVKCTPLDAWYEVYKGADVEMAVKGYVGPIHPTVYYLAAGVGFFLLGNFFWKRYIKKPKVW